MFTVISFSCVVGSRSALVLVVPRGGGFVCPQCWFASGVGRSAYAVVLRNGFARSAPRVGRPRPKSGKFTS